MPKAQNWSYIVDNKSYQISFIPNQWSGKHKLTVNGEEIKLDRKPFQSFAGLDQPINFGGKEARFVLIGNKVDIAIDGKYLSSRKAYMPLKSIPGWVWIFVVACALIPIVALGGAIPALLGVAGAIAILRVAILPKMKTGIKLFIYFFITIVDWAVFISFISLLS
nr:hypothetical protein [uncultured Caproiciproducens sp.]